MPTKLSKIKKSILNGDLVTEDDWLHYLSARNVNETIQNNTYLQLNEYLYRKKLNSYQYMLMGLKLKRHSNVLDIGCSDGALYKFLPDSINYYGLDIDLDIINLAKKLHKDKSNVQFLCDNIFTFKSNLQYDYIFSHLLLHMFFKKNIKRLISNIYSQLNSNGTFIFVIRNSEDINKNDFAKNLKNEIIKYCEINYPNMLDFRSNKNVTNISHLEGIIKTKGFSSIDKKNYRVTKLVDTHDFISEYIESMHPCTLLPKNELNLLNAHLKKVFFKKNTNVSHHFTKVVVKK